MSDLEIERIEEHLQNMAEMTERICMIIGPNLAPAYQEDLVNTYNEFCRIAGEIEEEYKEKKEAAK